MFCVVACPAPEIGTNIKPVPQSLNCSAIGTIYTYECLDCYVPLADLLTICLSNGSWSLPPPTCVKGMYLAVINLGISFYSLAGTTYTYECLDCYVPPENLVTICQRGGRWSLPPPICEKRMYLTEIKIKLIFWKFMRIQLYFVNHSLLLHISRKYDFLLKP